MKKTTDQLAELTSKLRGPPGLPGRGRPGAPGPSGLQGATGLAIICLKLVNAARN